MPNQYQSSKNLSIFKPILKFIGLVGTLAIHFSLPRPVLAAFLTNWFFDPDNNQLEFTLPPGTTPSYAVENKPARLVLYIPDTEVSVNVTELYPAGLVRRVSLSQEQPEQAKVTIDFAPEVILSTRQVQLQKVGAENSWELRLFVEQDEGEAINQSVEPEATTTEIKEVETDNESTVDDGDNQAVIEEKQDSVGFLETNPAEESALPNPPPSGEPSVPFLVVPTDKPSQLRSPVIDALSNQESATEPSEIGEIKLPTTENTENEETIVTPPPAVNTTESLDVIPSETGEPRILPPKEETIVKPPPEFIEEEPKYSTTESVEVITFGEPLPGSSANITEDDEDDDSILIEEGDVISLIYPSDDIILPPNIEIQQVLLLEEAITDKSGRVIVPARTPVVGGFDSTTHGSKFIARAIYVNGRLVPFAAESELLQGHRHVNGKVLGASTAGGGLGLLLLTGSGFGFLAGAAIGAATVVATSPRSAVILESDTIVEVVVIENLPRSRFY